MSKAVLIILAIFADEAFGPLFFPTLQSSGRQQDQFDGEATVRELDITFIILNSFSMLEILGSSSGKSP